MAALQFSRTCRIVEVGQLYSALTASIFLPSTFISMPRGGRRSEPCTMAPRAQTLPGRLLNLSGSYTVRLQGFPTMGCLAALKP